MGLLLEAWICQNFRMTDIQGYGFVAPAGSTFASLKLCGPSVVSMRVIFFMMVVSARNSLSF
ncbi:protein of unknown function [Hyphomicrobium sp. 1Nfss2.1]